MTNIDELMKSVREDLRLGFPVHEEDVSALCEIIDMLRACAGKEKQDVEL